MRVRPCVTAGKQRYVVSELHQRVGKVGDNPLGASVELWRHGFDQRGDLGDFQRTIRGARQAFHGVSAILHDTTAAIQSRVTDLVRFPCRAA